MKNKNIKFKLLSACILTSLTSTHVMAQSQHYVPDSVVSNAVKNVVWGTNDATPKPPEKYKNTNKVSINDDLKISEPSSEQRKPSVVIHKKSDSRTFEAKEFSANKKNLVIKKNNSIDNNNVKEEIKGPVVKSKEDGKEKNQYIKQAKHIKSEPAKQVQNTKQVAYKNIFKANKGEKLSEVLTRWAEKEDWNLYWSSKSDFFLPTDIELQGGIETVFVSVGEALKREGISFDISLYRLNKTVVVK